MKKTKNFIYSLILIGTPLLAATMISTPSYAQYYNNNSTWEYIGDIQIHGKALSSDGYHLIYDGSLFAKTLGNRIIYKVISYGKEYSVSRCTDVKGYNAKTSLGYLNVPEW